MQLFRRSPPGRVLRPSWHGMVNGSSTGAVLFAVARDTRLTDANVLGQLLSRVPALFYVLSWDQEMADGETRGVRAGRGSGAA